MELSTREMTENDIKSIVNYFVDADIEFLRGMGADKSKLPSKEKWIEKLKSEFKKSYKEKEFYYVIWQIDEQPVGHSNINNIIFGESATMHLHLWRNNRRKKGLGFEFVKRSIPYYFKNFDLKYLICEPYSKNAAPNKMLKRIGFDLKQTYDTIPGWINFHQTVNRYELTKKQFYEIGLSN